jgi:hypothetical protein
MVSMSDAAAPANFIELAADIVSAYVAKNSLPASELPALINHVHAALVTVATGTAEPAAEARKPAVPIRRSIYARLHHLPRRREQIQVAQAASADAVRSHAGAVPREVGSAVGLSDGGAQLRQGAL